MKKERNKKEVKDIVMAMTALAYTAELLGNNATVAASDIKTLLSEISRLKKKVKKLKELNNAVGGSTLTIDQGASITFTASGASSDSSFTVNTKHQLNRMNEVPRIEEDLSDFSEDVNLYYLDRDSGDTYRVKGYFEKDFGNVKGVTVVHLTNPETINGVEEKDNVNPELFLGWTYFDQS